MRLPTSIEITFQFGNFLRRFFVAEFGRRTDTARLVLFPLGTMTVLLIIAGLARENELVPNPLRMDVHAAVARAVAHAAQEGGVARQEVPSDYMLEADPFRALRGPAPS